MKKIILVAVAMFFGFTVMNAQDYEKRNIVSVSAQAEREVEPDEITLSVYVDKEVLKNKMTIDDAEKAIIDVLRDMNVDIKKNFRMQDIGSNTKVGLIKRKNMQNARYALTLSSVYEVQMFIEKVSVLNISYVDVISTDVSNREEIIMELRKEAVKKAQNTAEVMTEVVGQKVGRAVFIQDNTNNYNYYRRTRMYAIADDAVVFEKENATVGGAGLKFENIKLKAEVSVDFELE